jgi:hypothetical protein
MNLQIITHAYIHIYIYSMDTNGSQTVELVIKYTTYR